MRRLIPVAVLIAVLLGARAPARAAERPSTEALVGIGLGLAVPVYFLDVALHEGSHALMASAFGANVVEMRVLPSRYNGRMYFGLTRWEGQLERHQLAWVLISPTMVHGALLTGYAFLVGLGGLPSNAYAQLGLAVLATGSWVDFSKDIVAFTLGNDIMKLHYIYGRQRESQRFPYRVLHAALSAAAGYFVVKGWISVFSPAAPAPPPMLSIPLFRTAF